MDAADALATLSHASLEVATRDVAALAPLARHPGALFEHIAWATASRAFALRCGTIAYACSMIQSIGFVQEVHCRAGLDEQANSPGEVELAKALEGFASRILTAAKQVATHRAAGVKRSQVSLALPTVDVVIASALKTGTLMSVDVDERLRVG
mmetsp:Transcript_8034/g.16702  ORF Transcript_8034/g.16702 Transcript_8034/m.16702 type:complete len:153 (+) Transcript_8034:888-1346(+)